MHNLPSFDIQYKRILEDILRFGYAEKNHRTGHICTALPGKQFFIDLQAGFPLLTLRKIPLKVFIAEQIWFLTGEKELSWLQRFTRIWDDFAEEDNTVAAAYGYRWRHHFGRDQIAELIKLLTEDPSSRHGVVVMWDPADDGLWSGTKKKNVPCPYTFTVQIIGGKLSLHLVIRSNDMILGCPHDVGGFALLAHIFAQKLGVKPGYLTVSISNAHIYDIHLEAAKTMVAREPLSPRVQLHLPEKAYERAMAKDEGLVEEIFEDLSAQYESHPSLGRLPIVL